MNRLLERQVRKHLDATAATAELSALLKSVSDAYDSFDEDRQMMERAFDVSSAELIAANERLQHEIVDHKKTEERRRDALSRFEAIFRNTPAVAIHGYNREGVIQHWNPACSAMYGFSAEDVLGIRMQDIVIPREGVREFEGILAHIFETGKAMMPQERRVHDKHGRDMWVYSSIYPVLERGSVVEVFCMDVDITERKSAEAQLTKALNIKEEILANVSHELRIPLTNIIGFTHLLVDKEHFTLPAEASKNLFRILRNAEMLLKLVNNVLEVATLDRGEVSLSIAEYTLGELVHSAVEKMRGMLEGTKLALEERVSEALVVFTDRDKFEAILINLISNAIKFTKDGFVRVSAEPLEDRPGWIAVSVTDTGIGIPQEKCAFIFEKFSQIEGSSTRRYRGTGLGLYIVHEYALLLGGEISVESELGHGSIFTLRMPVSLQKQRT